MNKIIITLCIGMAVFDSTAQVSDTIYGRVFSSLTQERPAGDILITEKGTGRSILADSLGEFKLVPKIKKDSYILVIMAGYHDLLEYQYEAEWTQRTGPKSIVVRTICNEEQATLDWKKNDAKIIIWHGFVPLDKSRLDQRFERKYKVKYASLNSKRMTTECATIYNRDVFLRLDLKYGQSWRKKIRGGAIGLPFELR